MIENNFNYAAVVVTFNRKKLLLESIINLMEQTILPKAIVIVDNASTDGTQKYLEDNNVLKSNVVHYVRMDENGGGSGGFYEGIKYVANLNGNIDWIALSDDDAMYDLKYFENIMKATHEKKYENVQFFAGSVRDINGNIALGHRKYINDTIKFGSQNVPSEKYKENFYADFASFVGATISLDIVRKIGLPKKNYFIWFDDFEYNIRIHKLTKLVIIPDAIVIHKSETGSQSVVEHKYNWKEYYGVRNRIWMVQEHSTKKWLGVPYIWLNLFVREIPTVVLKTSRHERKKRFQQYIKAARDAIIER